MDIVVFRESELPIALGTLRGLIVQPSVRQVRYLSTLARLHGASLDLTRLRAVPAQLAAAIIQDPQRRKRLIQLAVILVLVNGKLTPDSHAAVAALARALDVDEPAVDLLPLLAERRELRTRVVLMRRVMRKFVRDAWREQRWSGVGQLAAGFLGRGGDRAMAERYARLQQLPAGSLGRTLWEHCTARQFALPGQPGAIPERMLFHDIGHVLSGYDTDPAGEIRQAAFQAGFVRNDGFAFLFFGVVQFHLGIRVTPVAEPERGLFDVEEVLQALARGAACRADLSDHWDFWSAAARPLNTLRDELGIPPLSAAASLAA